MKIKCPYLSVIGMTYIQCSLHCRIKNKKELGSQGGLDKYIDSVCYGNFDTCITYQTTYAEEINSNDKWILDYRKCAFCCNNSGYTGLKIHHGSTHCYCQVNDIEVEKFNPITVCDLFNRKAGSRISNIFDLLKLLSR